MMFYVLNHWIWMILPFQYWDELECFLILKSHMPTTCLELYTIVDVCGDIHLQHNFRPSRMISRCFQSEKFMGRFDPLALCSHICSWKIGPHNGPRRRGKGETFCATGCADANRKGAICKALLVSHGLNLRASESWPVKVFVAQWSSQKSSTILKHGQLCLDLGFLRFST